ncbi:MAG: hypothetical protein U0Q15_03325 [Kineosporiaceae bacterium]
MTFDDGALPALGDAALEARLAAALDARLGGVVADPAALRVAARRGSRRVRRQRALASAALALALVGGLGRSLLDRPDQGAPKPLPVATPSVTLTETTRQPSPTVSPTSSPSLQVLPTPTTLPPSATSTATSARPSGTAASNRPTTSAPVATRAVTTAAPRTTALDYNPDRSTWDAYGAFRPGDWLSVGADAGWGEAVTTGPMGMGDRITLTIVGNPCWGDVTSEGLIAARFWEYQNGSDYGKETVTAWEPGTARAALARLDGCYPARVDTPDRLIEVEDEPDAGTPPRRRVRAVAVVNDTIIGLSYPAPGTVDEIVAEAQARLDAVASRLKAQGRH